MNSMWHLLKSPSAETLEAQEQVPAHCVGERGEEKAWALIRGPSSEEKIQPPIRWAQRHCSFS